MPTSTAVKPQRLASKLLVVLVLLGISVFINYIDRGNLSIAAPMLKDELSISAPTRVFEVVGTEISNYTVTAEEFGLEAAPASDIPGGDPAQSADIARRILAGDGPQVAGEPGSSH